MKTLALARAKVNFTLEVLGMRPDGYHDLRSLVVPIALADEILVEDAPATVCTMDWGEGIAPAPIADPEKNLAVKAVRLIQSLTGLRKEASLRIKKLIPAGGGLGGGSADAAAVLVALNGMWRCGFSAAELAAYSAAVGSDVPALVLGAAKSGGAVLMEGRGERVSAAPFDVPEMPLVLVNPGVQSSTPAVFAKCEISRLPERGEILYTMRQAISSGGADAVARALQNDLADAAKGLYPAIGRAMDALGEAAGRPAALSGSGATVFALADTQAEAQEIAEQMRAQGYLAWATHTCPVM